MIGARSGIGLFVNYMTNTHQSNFTRLENVHKQNFIIQVCDKAGELGGAWIMLSSIGSGIKWCAEFGYSRVCTYIAGRKTTQVAAEVLVDGSVKIGGDVVANSSTRQVIKEEIAYLTKEWMKFNEAPLSQKIARLEKEISEWLGKGTKMVKNKSGDTVFLSKDRTRRVRFDFENPAPHSNPMAMLKSLLMANGVNLDQYIQLIFHTIKKGIKIFMRILNEDSDKSLDKVIIYLTMPEAKELKDSLEAIINKPLGNHSHIPDENFEKELTICIYDVNNLDGFDDRSTDLILNNK